MWEWIKKLFSFITVIRQWFADQKTKQVKKLENETEVDHAKIQKDKEDAQDRLYRLGNSPDAFESELDKLRTKQGDSGS